MFNKRALYDGDTFDHNGRKYTVTFPIDEGHEPPWESDCGTGIVSEWTSRDKKPGERILHSDRSSKLFYDWQGTIAKAKLDCWGLCPDEISNLADNLGRTPTKGDIVAESVRQDFERLRGWCKDDWVYVGVVVKDDEGESQSVWGIESDCDSYLAETAYELANEMHPLADAIEAAGLELATD